MTVTESMQMAQKGNEDQGDSENEGENYEAEEMDRERPSRLDLHESKREVARGITAKELLKLLREDRAMSDTRVTTQSLTKPYFVKKSARRGTQSAGDSRANTTEPFQPDEKLTPENSGEMLAATLPSASQGDAKQKYGNPTTGSTGDDSSRGTPE